MMLNHNSGSRYRHTKIIATLGSRSLTDDDLATLISEGVDVFRLNLVHGSASWIKQIVARIRQASDRVGRQVAVMMDLRGREIQSGEQGEPISLVTGMRLHLQTASVAGWMQIEPTSQSSGVRCNVYGAATSKTNVCGSRKVAFSSACSQAVAVADASGVTASEFPSIAVNYPELSHDMKIGSTILVDGGLLRLKVLEKDGDGIVCEVLTPGVLRSPSRVNLPGVRVQMPSTTDQDKDDLRAGVEAGIDFVALSFARSANDIRELRTFLDQLGSTARIVAKIQDHEGVRNMTEIILEADAMMVARDDLGIEIGQHRVPRVQSQIVRVCQAEGKPVIVATHLLESTIESPTATRAEVADVSAAVRDQADAVLLSGEATTSAYPLESIRAIKKIIRKIEPSVSLALNSRIILNEPKAKMLRSAAVLAQELGQSGIVVFTRSGFLPYTLAALRPRGVPIYAFTDVEVTFRQLLLPWGVEPFLMDFSDDPEQTILDAIAYLRKRQWVATGTCLVVVTNILASGNVIDAVQLRQVESTEEPLVL